MVINFIAISTIISVVVLATIDAVKSMKVVDNSKNKTVSHFEFGKSPKKETV